MAFWRFPGPQRCDARRGKPSFQASTPGWSSLFWKRLGLVAALLLAIAPPARAAAEPPAEPFDEAQAFMVGGAVGTLVLPVGAPDMLSPAIVILQNGEQPDGRAARYTDQLLGSGFAVLEIVSMPDDGLAEVLTALALHPRLAGQPIGLLGFGLGARLAAEWSGPLSARALLYPSCAGLVPGAMPGEPVLPMHGAADLVNEPSACVGLG